MPHNNIRSGTHRSENSRNEGTRNERRERSSTGSAATQPFGDMGARSVSASLRLQEEMLEVFSDIGQDWVARATSEAELAIDLPNRLSAARSVPDVVSAYQEWLGEWLGMVGDDSRRMISNSRKIIDAGVRCFSESAPAALS